LLMHCRELKCSVVFTIHSTTVACLQAMYEENYLPKRKR